MTAPVPAEGVRRLLDYDPKTGIFRWREWRGGTAHAGTIAGSLDSHGHRQIKLYGALYAAQNLAWLYVTGEWPSGIIDHRDGDRDGNRFDNLRPATKAQNNKNRRRHTNNRSGFKGAYFHIRVGRWAAQIKSERVAHHLGYFDTPEEAHAAYCRASEKLHGEFGRTA